MGRAAAVGVVVLALAGCGGGDDATGSADGAAEETTAPEETPEETPAPGDGDGAVAVEMATTSLGEVLVDGEGMTLYMFDKDEQGESTCYDDCATAWPPLTVEGEPTVGEGLDDSMIATVERTDGTMQVTYNSWPLYYWQDDAAPGDVKGQAVNDVWWVLGVNGEPIRTAAETGY